MVKVLPEPVTPSSTWSRSPPSQAVDQLGDRLRLVAGRLKLGDQLERPPALGALDQVRIAGERLEQVERGQAFDRVHGRAPLAR